MAIPKRKIISFVIAYSTCISFGFHISSVEMLKTNFFKNEQNSNFIYTLISVLFLFAIFSGFLINFLNFKMRQYIKIIPLIYSLTVFGLIFKIRYILLLSRIIIGFFIGISQAVVPRYISLLGNEKRGFFVFLCQVFLLFGVFLGQVASYIADNILKMRLVFLMFSILNIILFLFSNNILEINLTTSYQKSFFELIKEKKARKSLFLAIMIHFTQQMSGIRGIIVYSNTLLKYYPNPKLLTMLIGLFSVTVTFLTAKIIDKIGRKKLLISSSIILLISYILFYLNFNPIFTILFFHCGYSIGLGPITWLLSNELFPMEYQKASNAICVIINWGSAFLIVAFFDVLLEKIGRNIYFIFIWIISIFLLTIKFLKETKNKELCFQ